MIKKGKLCLSRSGRSDLQNQHMDMRAQLRRREVQLRKTRNLSIAFVQRAVMQQLRIDITKYGCSSRGYDYFCENLHVLNFYYQYRVPEAGDRALGYIRPAGRCRSTRLGSAWLEPACFGSAGLGWCRKMFHATSALKI